MKKGNYSCYFQGHYLEICGDWEGFNGVTTAVLVHKVKKYKY